MRSIELSWTLRAAPVRFAQAMEVKKATEELTLIQYAPAWAVAVTMVAVREPLMLSQWNLPPGIVDLGCSR